MHLSSPGRVTAAGFRCQLSLESLLEEDVTLSVLQQFNPRWCQLSVSSSTPNWMPLLSVMMDSL